MTPRQRKLRDRLGRDSRQGLRRRALINERFLARWPAPAPSALELELQRELFETMAFWVELARDSRETRRARA